MHKRPAPTARPVCSDPEMFCHVGNVFLKQSKGSAELSRCSDLVGRLCPELFVNLASACSSLILGLVCDMATFILVDDLITCS